MATNGEEFSNESNETTTFGKDESGGVDVKKTWHDWVRHVIVTDLILLVVIYITIRLGLSLRKLGRKCLKDHATKSYKKMMKTAAFLLGISVTVHFADGIFEEIIVDMFAHNLCAASKWIKAISGSFAFLFSYLVIWIRQRSIYSEPTMRHLTTHSFRILSVVVVVLLIASPIANTIIYVSAFSFATVKTGCSVTGSTLNPLTPWIIIGVTSIVMQSILLSLFVLPLYRHQNNLTEVTGQGINLKPLIVRALVTASICTVTDTGTALLAASSVFNDGVTIGVAMQISTFINLLMVVLSFPDWKKTMFPFLAKPDYTETFRATNSGTESTSVRYSP